MVNCSVSTCKKRSRTSNMRSNGVSYHKFPKDFLWREQWIKFCNNNPGWKPSRTSVICSDHFLNSCWVPLSSKRRKLVDGAVPTVYSTIDEVPNSASKGPDNDEDSSEKIILGPGAIPTATQIEKIIDVHPHIRKLKQKLEMRTKKIRRLQSKILYMQNKLIHTENLLENLKVESLKYRQLKSQLKKKKRKNKICLDSQMIPSVKRVLIIKRALFNT